MYQPDAYAISLDFYIISMRGFHVLNWAFQSRVKLFDWDCNRDAPFHVNIHGCLSWKWTSRSIASTFQDMAPRLHICSQLRLMAREAARVQVMTAQAEDIVLSLVKSSRSQVLCAVEYAPSPCVSIWEWHSIAAATKLKGSWNAMLTT